MALSAGARHDYSFANPPSEDLNPIVDHSPDRLFSLASASDDTSAITSNELAFGSRAYLPKVPIDYRETALRQCIQLGACDFLYQKRYQLEYTLIIARILPSYLIG